MTDQESQKPSLPQEYKKMYPSLDERSLELMHTQDTYQDDGVKGNDTTDGIWCPRGNLAHLNFQPFCAPAPFDPDNYEIYNGSERVSLKWAYSGTGYLRAVPHIHGPILTVDNISRRNQDEFIFTQETKMVISDTYNASTYVSYRVDFNRKSFYLVPVPVRFCPDSFRLTLRESTRRNVVMEKLSDSSALYWYEVSANPFVHLKSLRHPEYALSFEDGDSAVMRRVRGRVKKRNFHVKLVPHAGPTFPEAHGVIRHGAIRTIH